MNSEQTCDEPDVVFTTRLAGAFRGGIILLAGATLWFLFLPQRVDPFLELLFLWLPSAWFIFAVGAFLGYFLPRWMARRRWAMSLALGALIGAIGSLILAAGFWLITNHNELIGLVTNRHAAGYASYSFSVRHHLQEQAWRSFSSVMPVSAIWICAWTIWARLRADPITAPRDRSPRVYLRFDGRLLRLVGWLAGGLALFATGVLLLTWLFSRRVQIPLSSFLLVGPSAGGLVILGPFLGPVITGCSSVAPFRYAVAVAPILLAGLAPFRICRQPVQSGLAVAAWCGFATAVLVWVAAGAICLGGCLG